MRTKLIFTSIFFYVFASRIFREIFQYFCVNICADCFVCRIWYLAPHECVGASELIKQSAIIYDLNLNSFTANVFLIRKSEKIATIPAISPLEKKMKMKIEMRETISEENRSDNRKLTNMLRDEKNVERARFKLQIQKSNS